MFRNDYSETCAPEVLKALSDVGVSQSVGYGLDDHCAKAEKLVLKAFGLDKSKADVHFLAGGTQANAVTISYFLRPHESVIAADTAHINGHETGAVEGTGHKIIQINNVDGKLRASDVEKTVVLFNNEHVTKPRMVYISQSTETGTIYTAEELRKLREVCDKHNLLLFMDGARLASGLTAPGCDVTPELVGELCDAFYAGGTKNGALFGEAVVLNKRNDVADFRYHIKNRGAMLAKGFVLGITFETLFTDDLYFSLARTANKNAQLIRNKLKELNVPIVSNSPTNQIFIKVSDKFAEDLMERFGLEFWNKEEDGTVVRIVTSFATKEEDCLEFIDYIKEHK